MISKLTNGKSLKVWIDSKEAHKLFAIIILINTLAVALSTSPLIKHHFGPFLELIELGTIGIFGIEIAIRLWAQRVDFFKGGWNIFDILVLGLSIIPNEAGFSVLRCFRILRTLSMFETSKHISHIIIALNKVWGQVVVALALMGGSFFILGVIGVELYGRDFPEYFGDLGWSMYTLFMLMQSDGYGEISKEVIEIYPLAWVYFVSVTVVLAFVMMNLFVGIVVDALQGFVEEESEERIAETVGEEEDQVDTLKSELVDIKKALKDIQKSIKKTT